MEQGAEETAFVFVFRAQIFLTQSKVKTVSLKFDTVWKMT